jgi:excisionase family DNA binding protein
MTQAVTPEKHLYCVPEVMDKLSLGRSALYRQMKIGRLRFVKVGRSRRIPASALADFVALLENEEATA